MDGNAALPARTLGAAIRENDDALALFREMRRREKEQRDRAPGLRDPHASVDPQLSGGGVVPTTGGALGGVGGVAPRKISGVEGFLNSDSGKTDYNWLLTPPGTPLVPCLDTEMKRSPMSHIGTPKTRQATLKSRLVNQAEPTIKNTLPSRLTSSNNLSTAEGIRRPLSSGGPSPASLRSATPTRRSVPAVASNPSVPKPTRSSTPTSRSTLPSKTAPPSRSSTPSRSSIPSNKPAPPSRPAAPPARSSTPSSRPSLPAQNKPPSRPTTPTRRSSAPASVSASSATFSRSSSVLTSGPAATNSRVSVVQSECNPATVRSRPWKPSEMPGYTLDAPPNLRTSLPERPTSASRGRPGAPSSRSSANEGGSNARIRRQSCSPARGRAPNGVAVPTGTSAPATRRSHVNGGDSVNPVLMGNKMVERVVNMRRLVPPMHDDHVSNNSNLPGKSSLSPDAAGFGRTLSKKSLDMAMRHMDIRRSANNLRPLIASINTSSAHSVRSGLARSRPVSVTDSPHATSSNASSEPSVNNMIYLDGIDLDDDHIKPRPGKSYPR